MNLPPKAQAMKDFKDGGGQDDNPYQAGTEDFDKYAWQMSEMWNDEFKAERQLNYR